jgi:beta-mannosidase
MAAISVPLSDGWSFTQLTGHERNQPNNRGTDNGEWLSAKVPTGVHEELLRVSRIPDPFIGERSPASLCVILIPDLGLNEHLVQWIGEETWAFKTKFTVTAEMHARPHIDLIFDGLDTYATVELDGKVILK